MTKLTQAQTEVLQAAAATDGTEAAPVSARTAAALIRRGLLISLPRRGPASRLLITAAGREAAGLPAEPATPARAISKSATPSSAERAAPSGKLGQLVAMLRREQGAAIDDLCAATGWQAHSVRGAISGTLKKKLGLTVASIRTDSGRVYRIVEGAAA